MRAGTGKSHGGGDRSLRAERLHIPLFLVRTALKINSPAARAGERTDTVKPKNSLALF